MGNTTSTQDVYDSLAEDTTTNQVDNQQQSDVNDSEQGPTASAVSAADGLVGTATVDNGEDDDSTDDSTDNLQTSPPPKVDINSSFRNRWYQDGDVRWLFTSYFDQTSWHFCPKDHSDQLESLYNSGTTSSTSVNVGPFTVNLQTMSQYNPNTGTRRRLYRLTKEEHGDLLSGLKDYYQNNDYWVVGLNDRYVAYPPSVCDELRQNKRANFGSDYILDAQQKTQISCRGGRTRPILHSSEAIDKSVYNQLGDIVQLYVDPNQSSSSDLDGSDTVQQQVAPDAIQQVVEPEAVQQVVEPDASQQVVQSEAVQQVVEPDVTQQVVEPEVAQQVVEPDASGQVIQSETTQQIDNDQGFRLFDQTEIAFGDLPTPPHQPTQNGYSIPYDGARFLDFN